VNIHFSACLNFIRCIECKQDIVKFCPLINNESMWKYVNENPCTEALREGVGSEEAVEAVETIQSSSLVPCLQRSFNFQQRKINLSVNG